MWGDVGGCCHLVNHGGERAPEREGEVDGDDGGDAGLLEDGDLARRRPRRVELHKCRTGLEARQLREQQRRRAGEDDADGVRAGEQRIGELRGGSQLGRERGRLLVQLDEAQGLSAAWRAAKEGGRVRRRGGGVYEGRGGEEGGGEAGGGEAGPAREAAAAVVGWRRCMSISIL